MDRHWRVAAAIATGFALLWFFTFTVEWHIRTGWQQHWVDGAIRAWADFAMLGWVDTTLIAGLLAFAGGTSVYIAATMQRRAQIEDRHRDLRETRLGQLNEAKRLLMEIAGAIRHTDGIGKLPPSAIQHVLECVLALRKLISEIGVYAPLLASILGTVTTRVSVAAENASIFNPRIDLVPILYQELAIAGHAATYLMNEQRLVRADGSFIHRPLAWKVGQDHVDPAIRPLFDLN